MKDMATARILGAAPLIGAFLLDAAAAQTCHHFGSHWVAPSVEPSPALLQCKGTPPWPEWHLFTPAHRAPGPHHGFAPGAAREMPRVLVAYRCTGWLLTPVVPWHVRTMGYVIDQPEEQCTAR